MKVNVSLLNGTTEHIHTYGVLAERSKEKQIMISRKPKNNKIVKKNTEILTNTFLAQ